MRPGGNYWLEYQWAPYRPPSCEMCGASKPVSSVASHPGTSPGNWTTNSTLTVLLCGDCLERAQRENWVVGTVWVARTEAARP